MKNHNDKCSCGGFGPNPKKHRNICSDSNFHYDFDQKMQGMELKTLKKYRDFCSIQWKWKWKWKWKGKTEDGKSFYARYSHGYLSWGLGVDFDDAVEHSISNRTIKIGDDNDSQMTTKRLRELTGIWSEFKR